MGYDKIVFLDDNESRSDDSKVRVIGKTSDLKLLC
ncbi:hypothetical protein [Escherichia coli]